MYQNTKSVSRMAQERAELSDAHCHLGLFENPEETVNVSAMHGLKLILTAGGSTKDNCGASALTRFDIVFAVVGIGPDFALLESGFVDPLRRLIKSNSKIIGIGEVGLDFKITQDPLELQTQRKVFEEQIVLSKELALPLVVHSRGAFKEVLELLDKHSAKRVMFHFFEGGEEEAMQAESRGYIISVPPVETNRRKSAIKGINLKNIVAETDSPIVGETPADVKKSLEFISGIRGIGFNEAAQITTENLREFFYI